MNTQEKIIEKQKEFIAYLTKAIMSESILEAVTMGARIAYESELASLESELNEKKEVSDEVIENFYSKSPDNPIHPDRYREQGAKAMRDGKIK